MSAYPIFMPGIASVIFVLSSLFVHPVKADSLAIEEVVVTARKGKAEDLQTVPMAINALSEQAIQEQNIQGVEDVSKLVSGLVFDTGLLPNDTRPTIRGLSTTRGRSNVATLIDFVDVSSEALSTAGGGMTANMRLADLQRVEVVKGPQSVLYGRSAFSGAINYITKRPSQEFEGQVDLEGDEHSYKQLKLALSGPVSDAMGYRINFAQTDSNGWYDNPNTGGDLNTEETIGGAFAFEIQAGEIFTSYTRLEYSDEEYGPRAQVLRQTVDPTPTLGDYTLDPSLLEIGFASSEGRSYNSGLFTPYARNVSSTVDTQGPNVVECSNSDIPFRNVSGTRNKSCRPILVGSLSAKESEVDFSLDPLKNKDFKGTKIESFRAHQEFVFDWDTIQFTSISAYTSNNSNIQEDFDLTDYSLNRSIIDENGNPNFTIAQYGFSAKMELDNDLDQFSQEFRLAGQGERIEWFVSGLYWWEDLKTTNSDIWWLRDNGYDLAPFLSEGNQNGADCYVDDRGNILVDCLVTAVEPDFNAPSDWLTRETEHYSIAASVTVHVTAGLSLTVEGRYLEEDLSYSGSGSELHGLATAWGNCGGFTEDFIINGSDIAGDCGEEHYDLDTIDQFVPRAMINWQVTDMAMIYLSYAEGFKPGGVDTTNASTKVEPDLVNGVTAEYEPEELESYEIGAKTEWLDGRILFNAAAFYYDYTNQQLPMLIDKGGIPFPTVVNAGESIVKGFEFDMTVRLTEGLTLTTGYTYSDAYYDDFNMSEIAQDAGAAITSGSTVADAGNPEADFSGNDLPFSARDAVTMTLRYDYMFNNGLDSFTEFNGSYQAKRWITPGNNAYLPSYYMLNFLAGLDSESWSVIVYVDNVFDDDTIKSGVSNVDYGFDVNQAGGLPAAANLTLPQPRTAGVRLSYRF